MEDGSVAAVLLLGAAIKQSLAIIAATLCIYFGYRLFSLTEQKSGEFEASANWGKVRLSQAAPGIYFTLFGCIVLIAALVNTSSFEGKADQNQAASPKVTPTGSVASQESQLRSISARGASAAVVQSLDWTLCAKSAAYGRNLVRSDPGYADLASGRSSILHERDDGLERITAYCVDQALGQTSFARYAKVESGGAKDASEKDRAAHEAVSDMLSE